LEKQDHELANGKVAFERGEFGPALSYLLPLAEKGNAQAQCYVAAMFQSGLGVEIDGGLAVEWYLRAAEQGEKRDNISGVAFHNLATIFVTGLPGVIPDKDRAAKYRREAVLLGVKF